MVKQQLQVGDYITVSDFDGKKQRLRIVDMETWFHDKKKKILRHRYYVEDKGFEVFANIVRFRTDHKYDNVILVTGEERVGKSYTALRLATMLDDTFTADRVIFDVYEDLGDTMRDLNPGNVVIVDEAGREVNNRNWGKKEQKELVTKFQVFGKLGVTVILVAPRYSYVDGAIRDTRIKFWLQCKSRQNGRKRGYTTVKEASRNVYTNRTFWKSRYHMKLSAPNKRQELKPLYEQYEAKKDEYIYRSMGEKVTEKDSVRAYRDQRDRLIWLIMERCAAAPHELEKLIGITDNSIRNAKSKVKPSIPLAVKQYLNLEDRP